MQLFTRQQGRWALLASLFTIALGGVWLLWPRSVEAVFDESAHFPDPRLATNLPARNLHPSVAYVGDASCTGCHTAICDSYAHHSMGRSATAIPDPTAFEAVNARLDRGAFRFEVQNRTTHRHALMLDNQQPGPSVEYTVKHAIGSGTRGRSYLIEREGHLFQSPLGWFREGEKWDLSPGYKPERGFQRATTSECLFCHVDQINAVPDTINQFRSPMIKAHTIGCERCHGPGQLHVEEWTMKTPAEGPNIINPKHLSGTLRDAICQQCHLQGEVRVQQPGRTNFDYRPGLPIDAFWTVFVRAPEIAQSGRSVGQFEQMHQSQCFIESKGEFGCVSCHDPHRLPTPNERVSFYRDRCMKCHDNQGCTEPMANRQAVNDSCIQCHMPKGSSSTIVHASVTDHRVLKRPSAPTPSPGIALGQSPIVDFLANSGQRNTEQRNRDEGIALIRIGLTQSTNGGTLMRMGMNLLDRAGDQIPYDTAARIAQADGKLWTRRFDEAQAIYESILAQQPDEHSAIRGMAICLEASRDPRASLKYWQRLQKAEPLDGTIPVAIARIHIGLNDLADAETQAREAVRIHPFALDALQVLETVLQRQQRMAEANDIARQIQRIRGMP